MTPPHPANIGRNLVHLSTAGYPHGEGLGILCGNWIFTCAHFYQSLPLGIGDGKFIEAWRARTHTRGTFSVLYGSTLDFMILAPDGMTLNTSEAGGTESSWGVIIEAEDDGATLNPCEITFPDRVDEATVSGFFFSKTGAEVHEAAFRIRRNSALVTFHSNDAVMSPVDSKCTTLVDSKCTTPEGA